MFIFVLSVVYFAHFSSRLSLWSRIFTAGLAKLSFAAADDFVESIQVTKEASDMNMITPIAILMRSLLCLQPSLAVLDASDQQGLLDLLGFVLLCFHLEA
jgi:hypothetical protein